MDPRPPRPEPGLSFSDEWLDLGDMPRFMCTSGLSKVTQVSNNFWHIRPRADGEDESAGASDVCAATHNIEIRSAGDVALGFVVWRKVFFLTTCDKTYGDAGVRKESDGFKK